MGFINYNPGPAGPEGDPGPQGPAGATGATIEDCHAAADLVFAARAL